MLTAAGLDPEPELALAPRPPLLALPPPEPPFPAEPFSAPPGAPGCFPSGEIAMRAARFPCGTLTSGAGGPGVAESAITRCKLSSPLEAVAPISGAAPVSACEARRAATALDIGSTGIRGC